MDNIEIIISDIYKKDLNKFVINEIKKSDLNLRSSHFYCHVENKDLTFEEISDFEKVLSPNGTGSIVFNSIVLYGVNLSDVVIVFSFDDKIGDIVINFPKLKNIKGYNKNVINNLVRNLMELKQNYNIDKILFGYESDEENMVLIPKKESEIDLEKFNTFI